MQRAHALKFKGKYDAAGRPDRCFSFAPARDLDARDIANLSDVEYADLLGGDKPLYVEVKPPAEKKADSKPKAEEKKAEAPKAESDPQSPDAPSGK